METITQTRNGKRVLVAVRLYTWEPWTRLLQPEENDEERVNPSCPACGASHRLYYGWRGCPDSWHKATLCGIEEVPDALPEQHIDRGEGDEDDRRFTIYVCPVHGQVEPWQEGPSSPRAGQHRCGDCVEAADHVADVPVLEAVEMVSEAELVAEARNHTAAIARRIEACNELSQARSEATTLRRALTAALTQLQPEESDG